MQNVARPARFARNTSTAPEKGSSPSASAASAAKACAPRRKSTGRVASRMRTPAGTLSFVPIVADAPAPAAELDRPQPAIEVEVAGAVVRVPSGADAVLLTAVLRALRASVA